MNSARILLVDDDVAIRDLYKEALEEEGFTVSTASDGALALRSLKNEPFDLVISDVVMPEKEGIELLSEIRKSFPSLPVIIYSGKFKSGPLDILDLAKRLGAEEVLAKPFRLNELICSVQRVVNKNHPLQES